MNLKLIDQQQAAVEWKSKYDNLLKNIHNPIDDVDVVITSEKSLNGPAAKITNQKFVSNINELHNIIASRQIPWVADMSNVKEMNPNNFAKYCKYIFGVRSPFEREISIALLNNCELTDDHGPSLQFILRNPNLDAIDLSHNDLSNSFLSECATTLKDRNTTPQYILLAGNTFICKEVDDQIIPLVDSFTEDTWGLTLSLPDFPVTLIHDSFDAIKKAVPKNKTTNNLDYKDM